MSSPNHTIDSSQDRQNDRFHAEKSGDLDAKLIILNEDEAVTLPCQLADISVSGCAVRVKEMSSKDVRVAVLRMTDQDGIVDLEVAGRLCWNQQTSVGSTTFGFSFRREMPAETINEMVNAGLITRRQEARISSGIEIQVRRAYGMPAVDHATLEDFSTTGVRLQIDRPIAIGERLLLCKFDEANSAGSEATRSVSGSVTVKWIRPSGELFECGCVFQNLASSQAINDSFAMVTA